MQEILVEDGTVTRRVGYEVAAVRKNLAFDTINYVTNTIQRSSLSRWESRALRPGEGPPRPLARPTLPLRGRVKWLAQLQNVSEGSW